MTNKIEKQKESWWNPFVTYLYLIPFVVLLILVMEFLKVPPTMEGLFGLTLFAGVLVWPSVKIVLVAFCALFIMALLIDFLGRLIRDHAEEFRE